MDVEEQAIDIGRAVVLNERLGRSKGFRGKSIGAQKTLDAFEPYREVTVELTFGNRFPRLPSAFYKSKTMQIKKQPATRPAPP